MKLDIAASAFEGLANPIRLAIVRRLVEAGPDGLAASALADAVELTPSNLSFHVKSLQFSGLVDVQRKGRFRIYSADFNKLRALTVFLFDNCCGGDFMPSALSPERTS